MLLSSPALSATPTSPSMPRPADVDALRHRCGWFESSHDLCSGLQLTVHDAPDAVAALLPLAWWLEWELAGGARPAH